MDKLCSDDVHPISGLVEQLKISTVPFPEPAKPVR